MLRAALLLLFCLNVGAALWWRWQPAAVPAALPAATSVPTLVLLDERPALRQPRAAAPVAAHCLSLGPFRSADDLREAMHRLTPHAARIQLRELPGQRLLGYRVYLPPAASREQAQQHTRRLAAGGIRDYYLVSAGEQRNAISLGLFRDLGNAERRRDAVRALGFAPVLEPRSEDALLWWIDLEAAQSIDWAALLPGSGGISAEPRSCAPAGAPDPSG